MPRARLWLALVLAMGRGAYAPMRRDELALLVQLYNATGGAEWNANDNWTMNATSQLCERPADLHPDWPYFAPFVEGSSQRDDGNLSSRTKCVYMDPCTWDTKWRGVGCIDPCYTPTDGEDCAHGRVTLLHLRDNGLVGTLPPEVFFGLRNITTLDLGRNSLSGTVPTQLGRSRNLRSISLDHNRLSGSLPSELALLGAALGFGRTEDTGALRGLTRLDFAHNNLSGIIPSQIGRLSNLQSIELGGNINLGYLPTSDPNLALNPGLPSQIGNLAFLQVLRLEGCGFRGHLPSQLGNLPWLGGLYLRGTGAAALLGGHPETNAFSGTIPTQIGRLGNVQLAGLSGNRLSGTIPSQIGNMYMLSRWELAENALSGTMPDVFDTLPNLEYWDTYANEMTGYLPPTIQHAVGLDYLYINIAHTDVLRNEICGERIPGVGNTRDRFLPQVPALARYGQKINWFIQVAEYFDMSYNTWCEDPYDADFAFNALALSGDI